MEHTRSWLWGPSPTCTTQHTAHNNLIYWYRNKKFWRFYNKNQGLQGSSSFFPWLHSISNSVFVLAQIFLKASFFSSFLFKGRFFIINFSPAHNVFELFPLLCFLCYFFSLAQFVVPCSDFSIASFSIVQFFLVQFFLSFVLHIFSFH